MKIAYSWTLEADLKVVVSPELNWFQGDRLVMLEGQDGFTVDEAYSSDVAASLCGYSVPATGFILWEKQWFPPRFSFSSGLTHKFLLLRIDGNQFKVAYEQPILSYALSTFSSPNFLLLDFAAVDQSGLLAAKMAGTEPASRYTTVFIQGLSLVEGLPGSDGIDEHESLDIVFRCFSSKESKK